MAGFYSASFAFASRLGTRGFYIGYPRLGCGGIGFKSIRLWVYNVRFTSILG
tara:strand:- start:455 stop:610 length:156 start_codon:yes stop_codon:yes gene_type:complete